MQTTDACAGEFRREFLDELHIAEAQLLALGEAVPAENYDWGPAEKTRCFSAVLVHIAVGNLGLLDRVGVCEPEVMRLYGAIEGEGIARLVAVVRKNLSLESSITEKTEVLDLLRGSFEAVRHSFAAATREQLEEKQNFFGPPSTVRRVYMRMLAHSHEHMGQAIAYARTMGVRVPWPDPLKEMERIEAGAAAG
jgi:hypothetical protein